MSNPLMKRGAIVALLVCLLAIPAFAQEKPEHGRGYVPSPQTKALRAASFAKHGKHLQSLAELDFPEKFETPFQIPQQNQGGCGSCWAVSGCRTISCAFVAAGLAKGDGSFVVSADTVMWCYNTGGCRGDDASTVMQIAKRDGLPINADVGEYKATDRGPCNKTAKRYKIDDWGYADADGDGSCSYQEYKAVVLAHGAVVVTVNAGDLIDGEEVSQYYGGGTNHQIIGVGWDDTKGDHGAILCVNQWGPWGFTHNGQRGYCWLGVNSRGRIAASGSSEVLWCRVENPTPPYKAPLSLFDAKGQPLEGTYSDLDAAKVAAQKVANATNSPVTIKDAAGKQLEIVTPTPPPPPQVTFTIPAYSFQVNGAFGRVQTVTIPARTITAQVSAPSAAMPAVTSKPVTAPARSVRFLPRVFRRR